MNELTTEVILNPDDKFSECVKFKVIDVTQPFVFHDVKNHGRVYTFSSWVRADSNLKILLNGTEFDINRAWKRVELTLTADSNDLELYFTDTGIYYLYHPKFELGHKATDWSPAPEDVASAKDLEVVDDRLVMAETSIEQTREEIALKASRTEVSLAFEGYYTKVESDAKLSVMADAITSSVSQTYATIETVDGVIEDVDLLETNLDKAVSRIGKAETSIKQNSDSIALRATKTEMTTALGNYYTKKESDAKLTVKADEITSSVSSTYATKTSLNNTQKEVNTLTGNLSGLTTRVGTAETKIKQNADAIALSATKSEVTSALGNYYTKTQSDSNLKLKADEITSTVASTYATKSTVNALDKEIDGLGTDINGLETRVGKAESSIKQNADAIALRATKEEVTKTLGSYYTKTQSDANLTVKANEITSSVASTYATKSTVNALNTRVGTAESSIKQNADAIALRATKSEVTNTLNGYYTKTQTDAKITAKADEITSSVSKTYATKSTVNTLSDRVTKAETSISQNGDSITAVAKRTSTVETLTTYSLRKNGTVDLTASTYDVNKYYPVVGSPSIPVVGYAKFQVNVQLNSGSKPTWSTHDNGFTCNLTARMKAHGWGTTGGNMGWIDDNYYAWCDKMPAYIHQMTNSSTAVFYLRGGGKYHIYSDYNFTWTPYAAGYTKNSQTVSPTDSPTNYSALVNNWTDHNDLTNAKTDIIEAQTTASDAQSRITTAESVIKQLADSISMLVTDNKGTSLMQQTSDGWTFNIGTLQSAVENANNGLSTLTNQVNNTNTIVNHLKTAVNDLGDMSDYINITTYESEPCIELGETDSTFKVLITNTRIMFMEGNSVPTYISNRTLITEDIEVKNGLKQGAFKWVIHDGENIKRLGLVRDRG